LGYTEWTYLELNAPGAVSGGDGVTVEVRVRNTGPRAGKEVVQIYLSRTESEIERPVRWLAGFAVVRATPDAEIVAAVHVVARAFQHWSTSERRWATEPGVFRVHAGRSVTDLPLVADINVG
jgi:beta-glucosidase